MQSILILHKKKIISLKIAIGLPAYNEEKNIGPIILKLKEKFDNILVCDDGSTDLTSNIAEKLNATVIRHENNKGYGSAISSLFSKAKEMNFDILVTFDADGQHKIEDIFSILEPIKNNFADIVIGSRFVGKQSKIPTYRRLGIKTISKFSNSITNCKIQDSQSGFRAYNKSALEKISPKESGMGISTEILIRADEKKLRIKEIPIEILYTQDSSTHNPVKHGASVMMSTLKYMSLKKPTVFYGFPGICFLIIGIFFISWSIKIYIDSGTMITNISLIGIGCIIVGIQLLITITIINSMIILFRDSR